MKTQAIIPTAGLGLRFESTEPKPLVDLKGKPVFIWTLMAFEKSNSVDSIILVVHREYLRDYQDLVSYYKLNKVKYIVPGGETRYESVKNGLGALDDDTDIVAIHDGARPLIEVDIIDRAIELCEKQKAVIVAVPVKQTIKQVDGALHVVSTIDRENVWEVQTPQVFDRGLIIKAYGMILEKAPTDDSSLVENMGTDVKVLMGTYKNIKITTKEDLIFAENFIDKTG